MIKKSSRPAVILGSLASRKLMSIDWASMGVPVASTAAAKGVMNEANPFSSGIITGEIKDLSPEEAIFKAADLVVSFGLRNTEVVAARPFAAPLINIDVVDDGLAGGFQTKINLIVEDIASCAERIAVILTQKKWGRSVVEEWKKKLTEELFSHPWLPAAVFKSLQKIAPESVLVPDTGLFCTIGETIWEAKSPSKFLGSSIGRFMGASIPTAIGLSVAFPSEMIVSVAGDGGIRPYFSEIKLAIEKNLPILFLFMSDGRYGSVATAGATKGFSKNAYEVKNSEWWRTAEATGLYSEKAENIAGFEKAVSWWLKNKKPCFIEAHFDPEKYINMTSRLR